MTASLAETENEGAPVDPADHVEAFQKTREAHRTELMEDYVELIADLIDQTGEARQIDIANRLGVKQPTVAKMLKRLIADELVQQRPYRAIQLTDEGRALAAEVRHRHEIVEAFLCRLGIDPQIARNDAEGIEHHVSTETLKAFERFLATPEA